jgi:hypothetical protein
LKEATPPPESRMRRMPSPEYYDYFCLELLGSKKRSVVGATPRNPAKHWNTLSPTEEQRQ